MPRLVRQRSATAIQTRKVPGKGGAFPPVAARHHRRRSLHQSKHRPWTLIPARGAAIAAVSDLQHECLLSIPTLRVTSPLPSIENRLQNILSPVTGKYDEKYAQAAKNEIDNSEPGGQRSRGFGWFRRRVCVCVCVSRASCTGFTSHWQCGNLRAVEDGGLDWVFSVSSLEFRRMQVGSLPSRICQDVQRPRAEDGLHVMR